MIPYLEDQLYKDAVLSTKNNEMKKSISYWVPLMNKYFVRSSEHDTANQSIVVDDAFYQNLPLVIEFLQSLFGYAVEVNQNNIFASDCENDSEEESEEETEEESEEEDENNEKHIKNTKFFQFGLKEEDEIDITDNEFDDQQMTSENNNLINIRNFSDFIKEGRTIFRLMIEFILSIINTKMDSNKTDLIKLYTILADCFKELDDIKNSLNYYNLALATCEQINNANLRISILLKIIELIKWSDKAMERSNYYFKIHKKSLIQAIKLIKSSKDNEYISVLPALREELQELKSQENHQNDIRSLHPDFDNVLKRALGQISTDTIKMNNVNDLSNLVQKKKPKRK